MTPPPIGTRFKRFQSATTRSAPTTMKVAESL
jgi:hypothetical protein